MWQPRDFHDWLTRQRLCQECECLVLGGAALR